MPLPDPVEEVRDLNIPDPRKPCVPLPELVAIGCPACRGTGERSFVGVVDADGVRTVMGEVCDLCGGEGAILRDRAKLRVIR